MALTLSKLPNTWFNVLLVFYIRSLMNRINKKSYSLSEPIPAPKLARVELYAWTGLLCQWNHRPAFLDGGKGKDVPKGWTWGSDELRSGVWKIDQTGNILIPSWVWQEDMQTHGLLSPSSIVVANQSQI